VPKLGAKLHTDPEKAGKQLKDAAFYTGLAGGGIGGVGGFNQASIYSAEAKKKRAAAVTKSAGVEAPFFGEEGISKEWKADASKFDSERSRLKRAQHYETAGGVATGGLAGGAVGAAVHGALKERKNWTKGQRGPARNLPNVKTAQAARRASALKSGKIAAGLGAGALAAGAITAGVRHRNTHPDSPWKSYAKRSAFGVTHEPVSKDMLAEGILGAGALGATGIGIHHLKAPQRKAAKVRAANAAMRPKPVPGAVGKAINIKPENEGKFTASAKKAGKGIQEHAHAVVASSKSTELQRKRAQFAINAKKWSHKKS